AVGREPERDARRLGRADRRIPHVVVIHPALHRQPRLRLCLRLRAAARALGLPALRADRPRARAALHGAAGGRRLAQPPGARRARRHRPRRPRLLGGRARPGRASADQSRGGRPRLWAVVGEAQNNPRPLPAPWTRSNSGWGMTPKKIGGAPARPATTRTSGCEPLSGPPSSSSSEDPPASAGRGPGVGVSTEASFGLVAAGASRIHIVAITGREEPREIIEPTTIAPPSHAE